MNLPVVKRPDRETLAKVQSLKAQKGRFAVIEPDTGEYFIAETLLGAIKKARKRYPDSIFYSIRIGYPFAHEYRGKITRL